MKTTEAFFVFFLLFVEKMCHKRSNADIPLPFEPDLQISLILFDDK